MLINMDSNALSSGRSTSVPAGFLNLPFPVTCGNRYKSGLPLFLSNSFLLYRLMFLPLKHSTLNDDFSAFPMYHGSGLVPDLIAKDIATTGVRKASRGQILVNVLPEFIYLLLGQTNYSTLSGDFVRAVYVESHDCDPPRALVARADISTCQRVAVRHHTGHPVGSSKSDAERETPDAAHAHPPDSGASNTADTSAAKPSSSGDVAEPPRPNTPCSTYAPSFSVSTVIVSSRGSAIQYSGMPPSA